MTELWLRATCQGVSFVRGKLVWLSGVLLCIGCESTPGQREILPPTAAGAASSAEPDDPCLRASLSAPPRTVTDVVDHLNTLPKPVTLPCLLSSLPGPLPLHATRSVFSAQPAVGQRSPRIFLLYDTLTLSIALDGMGKDFCWSSVSIGPSSAR